MGCTVTVISSNRVETGMHHGQVSTPLQGKYIIIIIIVFFFFLQNTNIHKQIIIRRGYFYHLYLADASIVSIKSIKMQ